MSLQADAGDHLGAEDELIERLAVSRPTLRQAAKIVEADKLLQIRRGVRGGFYATRPDAADAIRAPARYLRLQGATLADLHVATRLIMEEVAALAAESDEGPLRRKLEQFRTTISSLDSAPAMVRADTELARLLAQMSGNPAAELYIEIGYTFGLDEQHLRPYQRAEDRKEARILQDQLAGAVLARDADVARIMVRRRAALIGRWLAGSGER